MFTPGDKLEYGHYTVLRELGAGGMGVVYHCRDEFLQREIAIKMLLPELMADDDTVEVFRQEARLAAQLEHPNVVTIHNIGMENREGKVHHYIAMEFLPGGSLKQSIIRESAQLEQCLEWMKQLAIGLNYAHKRGVVHQDIKPDNIFITHDGNLKIGDFGLALIATGVAVERAVQGKGTPAYMSPELCRGDPQDHRSDIYSLGAVFYELLTRERPYKASGMIEMAMKHATAPIPSARKVSPDIPDVLDRAVQKMMAKGPDDRYQSLAEVLTILEKLLLEMQVARLGVGTGTLPISTPPPPEPPKKKKEEKPPQPQPSTADYADEYAKFVAGQQPKVDTKGAVPLANKKRPQEDPLDDLLNQLLPDNRFDDDVTGDIDGNFQELVKAQIQNNIEAGKVDPAAPSEKPVKSQVYEHKPAQPSPPKNDPLSTSSQGSKSGGKAGTAGGAPIKETPPPPSESPRVSRTGMSSVGAPNEKRLDLIWIFKTQGPIGWASMPVISRDRKSIFVGSSDGTLYSLDAQKGTKLWRFSTGGAIMSSPVLSDDRIIVASSSGSLYTLSSAGAQIWVYNGSSPLVATPVLHNDGILVSSMDGSVKLLNAQDGTVRWTYSADGPVVCSPQVLENLVFFGSKDKMVHAVSLDRGLRHWTFPTMGPVVSTPLVSTDSVYVGASDGKLYSLEAETGKVVWRYAADKPIISKGTLEFTSVTVCSEDKWIHCIEKYKGELVWKARVHGSVMSNLVSSTGNLYCTTREGWLQCFNLRTGELRWQMNCDRRLEATPLVTGKIIYLACVSGEVIAYNLP